MKELPSTIRKYVKLFEKAILTGDLQAAVNFSRNLTGFKIVQLKYRILLPEEDHKLLLVRELKDEPFDT